MTGNIVLKTIGIGGLSLGLLVNSACDSPNSGSSNYPKWTIKGRALAATVKDVRLEQLTEDDIGSYVIIKHKGNSENLHHPYGDDRIRVYSSRMDAVRFMMEENEESTDKLDVVQIINENFESYKKTGYLNGMR